MFTIAKFQRDKKPYVSKLRSKWKSINEIADEAENDSDLDDDDKFFGKTALEKKAINDASAEQAASMLAKKLKEQERHLVKSNYTPPNLLEWDREHREKEEKIAEEMLKVSRKIRESTAEHLLHINTVTAEAGDNSTKRIEMTKLVMAEEAACTDVAIAQQAAYVSEFRKHAADNMVTVLAKIYHEVLMALAKKESRIYFR